jgi:hypothetical protein
MLGNNIVHWNKASSHFISKGKGGAEEEPRNQEKVMLSSTVLDTNCWEGEFRKNYSTRNYVEWCYSKERKQDREGHLMAIK